MNWLNPGTAFWVEGVPCQNHTHTHNGCLQTTHQVCHDEPDESPWPVRNKWLRTPGLFLWAVTLPIHQVLESSSQQWTSIRHLTVKAGWLSMIWGEGEERGFAGGYGGLTEICFKWETLKTGSIFIALGNFSCLSCLLHHKRANLTEGDLPGVSFHS